MNQNQIVELTYSNEEAYKEVSDYLIYKFGSMENVMEYERKIIEEKIEELGDKDYISNEYILMRIIFDSSSDITKSLVEVKGGGIYGLTEQEVWYCTYHPLNCNEANRYREQATNQAESRYHYGSTLDDFPGNAFKHSFWSALMAYGMNENVSKEIACRYEEMTASKCDYAALDAQHLSAAKKGSRKVDLNNNAYGRKDGVTYKGPNHSYYFNKYGSLASWQEARVRNGDRWIRLYFKSANKSCNKQQGGYYTGYRKSNGLPNYCEK